MAISELQRTSQVSEKDIDDISLGVDLDGGNSHSGASASENVENLNLKAETRKTSVLRCLVITTLLTTAAIVANVALIFALNEEEIEFKNEYTKLSNRLIDHFFVNFAKQISAADALASQIQNTSTIPHFEVQADGFRKLSSSTTIAYSPILRGMEEREAWETYALTAYDASERSAFVSKFYPHDGKYDGQEPLVTYRDTGGRTVNEGIYKVLDGSVVTVEGDSSSLYAPIWQVAPFNDVTKSTVMFNQLSELGRSLALQRLLEARGYVISDILHDTTGDSLHDSYAAPIVGIFYPIFPDVVKDNSTVVGVLTLEVGLECLFENVLEGFPDEHLTVVVETSCGLQFSFLVKGESVTFLGQGSLQENIPALGFYGNVNSTYAEFEEKIQAHAHIIYPTPQDALCSYRIFVYPTEDFHRTYLTSRPVIIEAVVGLIFLFTVAVFLGYDCLVERRQRRVLEAAQTTNALVSSIFPQAVRDRLYQQAADPKEKKNFFNRRVRDMDTAPKLRLKNFISSDGAAASKLVTNNDQSEPIADLFPTATVLFGDISGFTAWSSEREPSQVFVLLETLYGGIDSIARKLGVFKVETVGDCYVAATGIPDPRDDHAITMVRFANAMLLRVNELTKALESTLGPGTGDLDMRVGIHSGPVTAGVLRGEKSRFQLFGDTMNTASRMESTSTKGKIQLSNDTATLLTECGKAHWITPREDLVDAKGKGAMQTFWLVQEMKADRTSSIVRIDIPEGGLPSLDSTMEAEENKTDEVAGRLIDWNVQVMMSLIQKIMALRGKRRISIYSQGLPFSNSGGAIIDEVKPVIHLPKFSADAIRKSDDYVTIPPAVQSELRDYVSQIAASYNDNPFHNFEHASHVCLSTHKLLKRITRPDEVNYDHKKEDVALDLHEHTYGISSDPLTQLAVVFSALIHDAGHTGVPNSQLAKEFPAIAAKYRNQSVAEQRSVDISWELLRAPCYSNLRACLFPTKEEQWRFRSLIVNSVMATDIFDKDQGVLRKARWDKAFGPEQPEWTDNETMDRKATIVIEHVIQASDVAHTMQHWHVYQKWNELLFREMYSAFVKGRSDKDPSLGWYKGELWFFDNYVIPLAKKLKDCGVFGVSSDEYLNYAVENRREWEKKGTKIVAAMLASMVEERMSKLQGTASPEDDRPEAAPLQNDLPVLAPEPPSTEG